MCLVQAILILVMFCYRCVYLCCVAFVFYNKNVLMKIRYIYIYVLLYVLKALHGIAKLLLKLEEEQKTTEVARKDKSKTTEFSSDLWSLTRQVHCSYWILV